MAAQRSREAQHKPRIQWWQYLAGLFGMPVEEGEEMLHRPPWVTWGLTALVSVVSGLAFLNLEHWIAVFGLIPAQAGRYAGLTFLTAFFLHGGIFHLAANMYFLLIFGDNVEETLGVGRDLLLIFLATVIGGLVHVTWDPSRDVPVIGASAGIAGIVAFYALRFPRIGLKFFLWFRWYTIPAWAFFGLWILSQAVGVVSQLHGHSNVSALGHVGGAAVGVLFYLERRFVGESGTSSISPGGKGG